VAARPRPVGNDTALDIVELGDVRIARGYPRGARAAASARGVRPSEPVAAALLLQPALKIGFAVGKVLAVAGVVDQRVGHLAGAQAGDLAGEDQPLRGRDQVRRDVGRAT
jgi:hypothetical protein